MNDKRYKHDNYEDISSRSANYRDDDFEDISSYSEAPRKPSKKSTKAPAKNKKDVPMSKAKKGKKKKRKNPFYKAFIGLLVALIIVVGAIFAVGYNMIGKMNYDESADKDHINEHISESELYSSKDVTNILLLGVDAREGEKVSRSDTMMLASIDRVNKKIKLTSFLRDSFVDIPGHGFNKLNAACTKGGVDLVMDTIEYNYKINIDDYMLIDFEAFENLIDAIGGVDVKVTEKEAKYLNNTWAKWSLTGTPLTFSAGDSSHLNGEEALMFCRIRKLDSDIYRTERQRRVISAVKDKVMESPLQIVDVSNAVLPLIKTSISRNDMMKLVAGAATSYIKYDIEQTSIPAEGTWHSEKKFCGDSLVFDIDKNSDILKDFIYFGE